MKIENCHIDNFGKLHDLDISFNDGITGICEENGWGKSTLLAFIRAMFYGFEGDSKRGLASERRRYSPWQGGPFGGSMTFCAGGKRYKVIRRFADKARSDEFLLYDAQTNLESSDYPENLGEALFLINKETFERTVFIEAGDCEAFATGDVNKLIGNLTEDPSDINNYEKARGRLKDLENNLSETRKTGKLFQKKAGITSLKKEIADGAGLEDSIKECEERLGGYEREAEEYKRQLSEITAAQEKEAARIDLRLKAEEYQRLCEDEQKANEELEAARGFFPGEIPKRENIDEYIGKCEALNSLGGQCRSGSLSLEEEDKLASYSKNFKGKGPDRKEIEDIRGKIERLNDLKEALPPADTAALASLRLPAALIIIGAAAAVCSIAAFAVFGALLGGVILCIAAFLLIFGIIKLAKDKQKNSALQKQRQNAQAERQNQKDKLEEEILQFFTSYSFAVRGSDLSGSLASLESAAAEYTRLSKKKETWSGLLEKYKEEKEKAAAFISKYSGKADPESYLTQQIMDIRQAYDKYETAKAALSGKKQKKEEFEKTHDVQALKQAALTGAASLEELQAKKAVLDEKLEELGKNRRNVQNEADRLRQEYDELSEKKERLKFELEDYKELKHKYENIAMARKFLEEARVSLTKRYTDPILKSFRNYFDCFSNEAGEKIRIDAELNISREEFGIPREIKTQSSGYQDMMGFCLRAAYADAMYLQGGVQRELPPLIFDDPFMALDEKNSKASAKLLAELAKKYQVIYFTCSPERKCGL